jgi:murein DD-endopeptidase MepM/ murein hydrolase activator NlpD
LIIGLAGAAVAVGSVAALRLEGTAPSIEIVDRAHVGSAGLTIEASLRDEGSGLRRVEVLVESGETGRSLLEVDYPGGLLLGGPLGNAPSAPEQVEIRIDPRALGLDDGASTLLIRVRDWSWRAGFEGNVEERRIPLLIDTQPPRIRLESGLTYVYRGGSAAAVYRVEGATTRDGVTVGDAFFRGYPLGDGRRVALFAIPVDVPPDPTVRVVAVDEALNRSAVEFPARVLERRFSEKNINLSERFLSATAVPLAEQHQMRANTSVEAFQQVNQELRDRSEEQVRQLIAGSEPKALWDGAFEQLRNSEVTSRFAEQRTYTAHGEVISRARHYGFDLASVAAAPIAAGNAGIVRYADDLGIYGRCVLIDHGLGLVSLYGHLSQIDVRAGDRVRKGQILGRTGETGLAGGDHLHFAIMVGGVYVDPLEWWDPKWVRTHVAVRIEPTRP